MNEIPGTIDEARYYKHNLANIKKHGEHFGTFHPGNPEDEARAKRAADIDLAIIYLLFKVAFNNGKHLFKDQEWITSLLRQFRPDLCVTDKDVSESLKRSVNNQRLVIGNYFDNYKLINLDKWVYNTNYKIGPEKLLSTITENPFISNEFTKLMEKVNKF
jgi:hypothetical protein